MIKIKAIQDTAQTLINGTAKFLRSCATKLYQGVRSAAGKIAGLGLLAAAVYFAGFYPIYYVIREFLIEIALRLFYIFIGIKAWNTVTPETLHIDPIARTTQAANLAKAITLAAARPAGNLIFSAANKVGDRVVDVAEYSVCALSSRVLTGVKYGANVAKECAVAKLTAVKEYANAKTDGATFSTICHDAAEIIRSKLGRFSPV